MNNMQSKTVSTWESCGFKDAKLAISLLRFLPFSFRKDIYKKKRWEEFLNDYLALCYEYKDNSNLKAKSNAFQRCLYQTLKDWGYRKTNARKNTYVWLSEIQILEDILLFIVFKFPGGVFRNFILDRKSLEEYISSKGVKNL